MDLDTLKLIAEILLGAYLILWAYNAYCGYRFLTDIETYGEPILTPLLGYEPSKLTNLFFAIIMGTRLPETRMQLHMLWYRFFPPKVIGFKPEDLKPLD